MNAPADRRALVLGAGIGGLAAACALAGSGQTVEVLEQAEAITEVGAGLQISPNGVRVLRALGIDPHQAGDPSQAVELRDAAGRLVLRMDLPAQPGFFLCHRADLIAALEHRARDLGVAIHLLQQAAAIDLVPQGVHLQTAVGATFETPFLIGADGLHSRLRPRIEGAAQPFFTGQVAWRATIEGDGGPPVAQVFMGPGRHLVSYPLRGGRLRNLVAVQERRLWAAEGWNHPDTPEGLRAAFAGFGGPVPEWLAAVQAPFLWGLFRHEVARHWHDGQGRAALLGDAAHPTLPFMAQGANMALEDAAALARHLTATQDRAAALAGYAAERVPRCRALVAAANANARNYHLRGPVARAAHATLRIAGRVAPSAALRRYAWIFDHDATRA